jgi:RHH-type transcriptional regulator, rel operon repressor / antitoxin RelB
MLRHTLDVHHIRGSMQKGNVTVRLDKSKIDLLDEFAASADRDRSYLIKEAIDEYLELKQWQAEEVRKAIAEADAEQFVPEAEIERLFAKWTQ